MNVGYTQICEKKLLETSLDKWISERSEILEVLARWHPIQKKVSKKPTNVGNTSRKESILLEEQVSWEEIVLLLPEPPPPP